MFCISLNVLLQLQLITKLWKNIILHSFDWKYKKLKWLKIYWKKIIVIM